MKNLSLLLLLPPLMLAGGCTHFGADKLTESRFNYSAAIGESWKDQMLLNVVKLRYGDVPVFLSVQSIIDQHKFTTGMDAGGNWTETPKPWWGASFGVNAGYSATPTVSYAPMGGSKFGKALMTPIPPSAIAGLLQAGWAPEAILRLSTHSINTLQNRFGLADEKTPVDANYHRLLDIITALQAGNALGLRTAKIDGKDVVVLSLRQPHNEANRALLDEFRNLLGLDAKAMDFPVVYGTLPASRKEIAILTRSILDVLTDLSACIEVPPQHLSEQRALPANLPTSVAGHPLNPLLRIHAGPKKPDDAFVSVPYHDFWYWIDDRDIASKNTFSFLMFAFTLIDTGTDAPTPSIVIPSN